MKKKLLAVLAIGLLMLGVVGVAHAVIIDFTGGTTNSGQVTNNSSVYYEASSYSEGGFTMSLLGGTGIFGDYYGAGNDVIHAHWATGDYGTVTEIQITQDNGNAFNLGYFELTSNTDTGGGVASGDELAYVTGYDANGLVVGSQTLLVPDDWGFGGSNPQIFLNSFFGAVTMVSFTVANAVDCFGMDMFYIDEDVLPPNEVPEPGTLFLLGSGLAGLALYRRKMNKA